MYIKLKYQAVNEIKPWSLGFIFLFHGANHSSDSFVIFRGPSTKVNFDLCAESLWLQTVLLAKC